jgi:beta-barrel assembly-enhancing protease
MKHWFIVAGIVGLGGAAVFTSERRKVDVPAQPAAVLYLVADTERELTRMPVRFTRMSDKDEVAIGNQLARFYEANREDKADPERLEVQRYVESVGARVATNAHRKLPYKFHYLPDPRLINAFALPGGHVYIGEGLISLMDSEDELAAVLGHEVEHIDHYHCAERIQQEQALRKVPFGGLLAIPIEVFEAGYGKNQELEADREGTQLSVEAGYSANGAIRMFEVFQRLYEQVHARATNPERELTQTALETLQGYFRSHPLSSERVAQIQKMIADEGWKPVAERDLQVAYLSLARNAEEALAAHQYDKAQKLATHSLKIKAGNRKALHVLARAQFSQANFRDAATSYRQWLDAGPPDVDIARAYALLLAASDRQHGRAEFGEWVNSIQHNRPEGLQVPLAGLSLLAGDPTSVRVAEITARQAAQLNTTDWAPSWLGDLAWWHYLAGEYPTALELIKEAIQQRPSDSHYRLARAWIEIQQRRLADAIDSLQGDWANPQQTTATYTAGNLRSYPGSPQSERAMALAVLNWQQQNPDGALQQFEVAIAGEPEWQNSRWVQALYSPVISESVQQMQIERDRRKRVNMVHAR